METGILLKKNESDPRLLSISNSVTITSRAWGPGGRVDRKTLAQVVICIVVFALALMSLIEGSYQP